MPNARTVLPLSALGAVTYVSLVERGWFRLRRQEIPLLRPGRPPLTILHISDLHLTPRRRRLMRWVRALDRLRPDLVVNTGDSIAHPAAVPALVEALGPLLDRPGVFVYGSNDLYAPRPENPLSYLRRSTPSDFHEHVPPDLPWEELGATLRAAGWSDLNNAADRVETGGLSVEVRGIHDSHIAQDDYGRVAGPADPGADVRLGVMHSPEPRNLDAFTADGFDLLLAGHTHGGQVRIPYLGPLITNCGIDRTRARGLHRNGAAWLHVSAGLGTSPYLPVRFCCPPEATLLTLVPAV
ncbi:metallophosphoesterase [Actinoallomurus rhizosphaericola]|uniref:metallophosphoesterase n=1 Tax=Actinoallomurus rhizosphaericola TaxID=2952536 RepID=UPI00209011B5|nr:metallophosphoesterase [Actinoallomurus rhizosphaericola]MCO5993892.1 metallophosphoesterase [Actinoallomurus rhizosphaericola]